jgi:ATP-dependent RNA helicase RhlE
MSFEHLGLRVELLKAVIANGYAAPTPVQTRAIPVILGGRDVLARAQTGTGKTDAFVLPLVDILSRESGSGRHPRALVLTPTRELALQVGEIIKGYARTVSLRCTVVYGGVRIEPQIERLRRGIDILVATPGRLLDLAGQRHLNLSRIAFLVFDEADRMLDMGFSREISSILERVPTQRRTMLFSATYTEAIRNLAGRMLKEPELIEATPGQTAAQSVAQKVHLVDRANKGALLAHLIAGGGLGRILVFVRTRHGADKLVRKLAGQGLSAAAIHSNKSQSFRTRTLAAFRQGEVRILVATDVAARGLDITDLPCVVNYDMPRAAEDYVHRIGRTGRAGVGGTAVSLVSREEQPCLRAVEKLLKQKIRVEKIDGYTVDSDVPDYVLYRPGSQSSEKTADREIKAIVAKRTASKQRAKARRAKAADPGKSNNRSRKKPSRPGSRAAGPSRPGNPRGKRRNR